MGLAGRNAVVTGGGSGMGVAICEFLARDGAAVAVLDLNLESADTVAQALRDSGAQAVAVAVDVADRTSVDAAMAAVRDALGPVDILVNSAGIATFVPFLDITEDLWDRMIEVNLKGSFNCVQAVITDMIDSGWGRIILISSSGAQSGAANQAHYIASKGGVIAMTKALAVEFGPAGVTVNTVPPGSIDTPLLQWAREAGHTGAGVTTEQMGARLPVGRIGRPEDIAAACAFLASEEAGYITGQILGVNGGRYM